MTVRLYRDDPFLWRFTARVRERTAHNGRPAVVLDRTAFYPAAGGQPHDLGALNGAAVLEVIERDDDEIVHVLDRALPDDEVEGVIDSARRIDHMQQHSGQHVLSQAFVVTANLDTAAVHIGADECTIDLPAARLPDGALLRAEDEANRIVFEDRPIIVRELSDAEAAGLPLRKPPKVTGRIRIVEVQGYDWSACGGTHVRSSAQIGVIKIARAEKRGEMTRVYFRCGRRALQDYRALTEMAAALVEGFRMSRAEILPAVERLREEARAANRQLADAQSRLLDYEARGLLAERADSRRHVIARAWPGRDAAALKLLAKRLTAERGVVALLGGTAGGRACLCFARSSDLPDDMGALLRGALGAMNTSGAKGGGSSEFAQGSAPAADGAAAQAALDWAAARMTP